MNNFNKISHHYLNFTHEIPVSGILLRKNVLIRTIDFSKCYIVGRPSIEYYLLTFICLPKDKTEQFNLNYGPCG